MQRWLLAVLVVVLSAPSSIVWAEVTRVSILSKALVAGGASFGRVGPYEKLIGRVEIALDPDDAHNAGVVDLEHASREDDGRVHFAADLHVLRPVDTSRGNGTLLFDAATGGNKFALMEFNRAPRRNDPTDEADFGDGFLMRHGYTVVWVGWQFDVGESPLVGLEAPEAVLPQDASPPILRTTIEVNALVPDVTPRNMPYPPADTDDDASSLSVRNAFWDTGTALPREQWNLVFHDGAVTVALAGGFEPGRIYELAYEPARAWVAGVGLAVIRDVASVFRYETNAAVRGQHAFLFGRSQSGRFINQFLHDGFNVDEHGRRVFDAVWPHVAGSARGQFNQRVAMPGYGAPTVTQFPFSTALQEDVDGVRSSVLAAYSSSTRPKVFATNASAEYWGSRAAALTHTTVDGTRDLDLSDDVRVYLLSGTQHFASSFPPQTDRGQALNNPIPHSDVMPALLRALHQWVVDETPPPESLHPRVSDGTLVPVHAVNFPRLPGVSDPRTMEGPARVVGGDVRRLPHLVPQVDEDGNEIAGIRVPEVTVPLATTTGWNFRAAAIGHPERNIENLGSYLPFAATREERQHLRDPRPSLEERYRGRDDYLQKIRAAAEVLVADRYLLPESLDTVLDRAREHWDYATRTP